MKSFKSWMALILAMIMTLALVPATVSAEDELPSEELAAVAEDAIVSSDVEEAETEIAEEEATVEEALLEEATPEETPEEAVPEEEALLEEVAVPEEETASAEEEAPLVDENEIVIYNLEKREISVGPAGAATEANFDENGNYTIPLEENAFFPYEIQFKYKGVTEVLEFESNGSTLLVDGHVFTADSPAGDEVAITQIGLTT